MATVDFCSMEKKYYNCTMSCSVIEKFIAEVFYLLTHFLHCDKNVAK